MMRYVLLVFWAALAGCATSPVTSQADFSELSAGRHSMAFSTEVPDVSASAAMRKGDAAFRAHELDRAIYYYIQSVRLDDSSPTPFYRIGISHSRRGNTPLAIKAFEYALARDPQHTQALEELGLIMLQRNRLEFAASYFERALATRGDRLRSHTGLGIVADLQGRHAIAQSRFEQALVLDPQSVDVLNNLGYSHYLAGNWDDADKWFNEALQLDQSHEPAIRNLALLKVRSGQFDKALALLRRVSGEEAALNDVGYLCMLDGQHDCAERYLQQAIAESASYYALAHENLAKNKELRAAANTVTTAAADDTTPARLDTGLFTGSEQLKPPVKTEPMPPATSPAGSMPLAQATASRVTSTITSSENLYLRRYVDATTLNVRADSSEAGLLLDKIRRGRVVRILRRDGEWAYILYWRYQAGGSLPHKGWVHESFLSTQSGSA